VANQKKKNQRHIGEYDELDGGGVYSGIYFFTSVQI